MEWQKIEDAPEDAKDMASVIGENYSPGMLRYKFGVGENDIYVFFMDGHSGNFKVTKYLKLPTTPA